MRQTKLVCDRLNTPRKDSLMLRSLVNSNLSRCQSRYFGHRNNPDRSQSSICLECFQTAVRGKLVHTESERVRLEAQHVCERHLG